MSGDKLLTAEIADLCSRLKCIEDAFERHLRIIMEATDRDAKRLANADRVAAAYLAFRSAPLTYPEHAIAGSNLWAALNSLVAKCATCRGAQVVYAGYDIRGEYATKPCPDCQEAGK